MKYSNEKNYRDQLKIEVEKIINNLDLPVTSKKNILFECFDDIKKKIINKFSKTNLKSK